MCGEVMEAHRSLRNKMSDKAVFARAEAMERVGDDLDLLVCLATLYLEEQDEMIESLQRAVSESDAQALGAGAHKLKGTVANFGAHACVEATLCLETMARADDLDGSEEAWADLQLQLKKLSAELDALRNEGVRQ